MPRSAEKAMTLPKTPKGQATRAALLESAIKLLATSGYGALTTQAVLDDTGLSRGSLLHQFPTRDVLVVAAAEAAMEKILQGIEHGFSARGDLVQAMLAFPDILWTVQSQLPARAYAEIQQASRWDAGLADRLRPCVAQMEAVLAGKILQFASLLSIVDVQGLTADIYLLLSATQGLAIGHDLRADPTVSEAARRLLATRFATALSQRLPSLA